MREDEATRSGSRRKGTGSNSVVEDLRARILNLDLAPGAHLDEASLVVTYGVSRTPVREALIRLGAAGLVVLLPNRGARVAPIELGNLREFFEAFDLCQRAVTRFAALRRKSADLAVINEARRRFEEAASLRNADAMNESNLEFHQAIGRAAGNSYIAQAYERLLEEGLRISRICLSYESNEGSSLSRHLNTIVDEHQRMEHAIEAGDGPAAEELAQAHTRLFQNRIIANMTSNLAWQIRIDAAGSSNVTKERNSAGQPPSSPRDRRSG